MKFDVINVTFPGSSLSYINYIGHRPQLLEDHSISRMQIVSHHDLTHSYDSSTSVLVMVTLLNSLLACNSLSPDGYVHVKEE